jgi:hypothetical protein
MLARIKRPAKNAMQSGRANTHAWVLEFEPSSARTSDPLTGWTVSRDTNGQVRLEFPSLEEAVRFADHHGIAFEVSPEPPHRRAVRSYADNFAFTRKEPWTH